MNARSEIIFRLGLADGFLHEAEQDMHIERWRSCVDNSQLAVENAGKAVLCVFGIPPKTHDPEAQVAALLQRTDLPPAVSELAGRLMPCLTVLGFAEHVLTDYGDEESYTLPWALFTSESARRALEAARGAVGVAKEIVRRQQEDL